MRRSFGLLAMLALLTSPMLARHAFAQAAATRPASRPSTRPMAQPFGTYSLADVRMRDVCILPDPATRTYYMVGPTRRGVRVYKSADLRTWEGPTTIYQVPDNLWGDVPVVGVWAPEMQRYNGRYYLFLTFDTRTPFGEQRDGWLPRVRRASQVLVGDSPMGPFEPFENRPTLPPDLMTLDATLWVEDGVPYMVYCHEWVQVVDGTIDYVRIKGDLSATVGEATTLFRGSDGPWSVASGTYAGSHVTDGPYLYRGKSGKLFMIWTSGSKSGYACGIAISDSGKLAGPWRQQAEPLFDENGGHGMLFTTFDGRLMLVLHAPNGPEARPRIFEMEDTGETLRRVREFTGNE